MYEIVQIGSECNLILKRSSGSDDLVYMVPFEEYYTKLMEAHTQTGHGGRDRMIYYMKKKWRIPRNACEIFNNLCETCNLKKSSKRKGVVVKPIISHGFNARGQVDLIDFQSCPDGEYRWLINYQDHATKFLHLRPIKSKHASNVAKELSKIFFTFGAPAILQSDNGREFTANVIRELVSIWPHSKMVHGRPRHPQTQGSVERANADVENMLRAWMVDKKSNEWARGCYEVQWLKNTSKHRIINRAPYEAILGPIRNGLACFNLPDSVTENLETEEDLENALSSFKELHANQEDLSSSSSQTYEENGTESRAQGQIQKFCGICETPMEVKDTVSCMECDAEFHFQCVNQVAADKFICLLCARGKHLLDAQEDCNKRQKIAAEKMVTFSQELFPPLSIGDCVTITIPSVDRGPLDFGKIFGIITDFKNGVYQVGTENGVINVWFPRTEIEKSGAAVMHLQDVQRDISISLREAASYQSSGGGQGYKKCNCMATKSQCSTKRCSCFKSKIKCGSRCHNANPCNNK
ncbi:KRAB-A domain-containing protein 2-like [Leptopilina boulardi]|uniref:KRAB-A domain-containing protein 2-like n=2 Tax=Leptopilina boulardi TaxID=63433 RepID=UPI0021F5A85D|nr:KRAB-A domain-containing protein 2-like [Leptopilina boulardi]